MVEEGTGKVVKGFGMGVLGTLGAVQSSLIKNCLHSTGVLFHNVSELFCNFVSDRTSTGTQII